jgi:hypothetical protein
VNSTTNDALDAVTRANTILVRDGFYLEASGTGYDGFVLANYDWTNGNSVLTNSGPINADGDGVQISGANFTGSTIVQFDIDGNGNVDAEIRVGNIAGLTADDFTL